MTILYLFISQLPMWGPNRSFNPSWLGEKALGNITQRANSVSQYCDTLFARCVMFPSAFSPNHDGLNDLFGPHIGSCEINKYKMVIYNRWGQMIFQTNNILQRWNGAINGYIQE